VSIEIASLKECISLVAREFWLEHELVTQCCCLFVGFDDGSWLKVYHDDEECIWTLVDSDEVPDQDEVIEDEEFKWQSKQYLSENMNSCGNLVEAKLTNRNHMVLVFSSKLSVSLSHDPVAETESIEVYT
jgi:hypothetical protein